VKFWQAVAFLETEQLLEVAQAADRLGFDSITVSDHVFAPKDRKSKYPYTPTGEPLWSPETPWPDPWVLIGAMSAVTTRLKFSTNVYIAPGRDLFTVAKLVSSAAVISGGRVSLGAAAGWCQEEFELAGQDFHNRGKRLNEMMQALRLLWRGGFQEFHGTYYDFEPLQIAPVPDSPIPIYVGGDSEPALRRAATLADGWIGNAYSIEAADAVLDRLHGHLKAAGRTIDGFETVIALYVEPTPDVLRRFEDRGVTALMCAPWMVAQTDAGNFTSPVSDKINAMEAFAEKVFDKV
jgi:probable F420-dependent oxidoreductase